MLVPITTGGRIFTFVTGIFAVALSLVFVVDSLVFFTPGKIPTLVVSVLGVAAGVWFVYLAINGFDEEE